MSGEQVVYPDQSYEGQTLTWWCPKCGAYTRVSTLYKETKCRGCGFTVQMVAHVFYIEKKGEKEE